MARAPGPAPVAPVAPVAFAALLALLAALGCTPPARTGAASARLAEPPTTLPVRLRIGADSELVIGGFPAFAYDGRSGSGVGTITDRGSGRWSVRFPAGSIRVPPLPMVAALPDLPLRVHIAPRDLEGTLDVCARSLALSFDADFTPEAFGTFGPALSVVTPLASVVPVEADGRTRLEGTARIPPTGDWFVDAFLSLPNDATARLAADLDVGPTGELPACPAAPPPSPQLTLEVGAGSTLSIGSIGPLPYDGGSRALRAPLAALGGGRYAFDVSADDLDGAVAALRPTAPLDLVRVDIDARSLHGELDACTGELTADLDARFEPTLLGTRTAALRVVTRLTGSFAIPESRLSGDAVVAPTGDWLVDLLVGLPTAARADLAAHLDTVGVSCAARP